MMTIPERATHAERMINATFKGLTNLLCRIEAEQLKQIPPHGPLIIVSNHINFLEIPIIYTRLQSSSITTGFAKAETWDNPLMGRLFDIWGIIPIRRGEADLTAIKRGVAALKQGHIMAVTPEGTRSSHGRLLPGHPGVVTLALLSGAPLLPVVHYGHETYRDDFSHLRRSDFNVVVGKPFILNPRDQKVTHAVRQQMTDEIMYQLAALLPARYRGAYADLEHATEQYLEFIALG
jgi:1-acyl-sn-glycerol-3-phosphate acyltransferase